MRRSGPQEGGIDTAEHARSLVDRGFTVFEQAYDLTWVGAVRRDLERLYDDFGRPVPFDSGYAPLAPDVTLCAAGFAVTRFLARWPERAPSLLHPDVVEAIRRVLGRDMVLEIAGAVLSNRSRPFFAWHMHVGGRDMKDSAFEAPEAVGEPQRVMALAYLQELDDDAGPMLVFPRKTSDPIAPPHDPRREDWDGQIELRPKAGSVIVIDQCTWHAVRRARTDALRGFVGCTFASRSAPRGGQTDDSLGRFQGGGALLESVLRRD